MTRVRRASGAVTGLLLLAAATAAAQSGGDRQIAQVRPLVEVLAAPAGATTRVALLVRLPQGFHMNSDVPRDPLLIPAEVVVDAPDGVTPTGIAYPKATDLKQDATSVPLRVFEREFAIGVLLEIAPAMPLGPLTIPVHLRYQACDEKRCYVPMTATQMFEFSVVAAGTAVTPTHPEVFSTIDFSRATSGAARSMPVPSTPPGSAVDAMVRLDDFTVAASQGGYLSAAAFTAFLHDAETGAPQTRLLEGKAPLAILLLVFLGGLALNLTPCVLPMIPINLAIIGAGVQAGSRSRGWLLGSVYGGAMALVYGVLGLVVILMARTFGALNASPWFNLAIAAVFVALALATFDVFAIDFSRFSSGLVMKGGRRSMILAFTMGSIAALLAGACVAPVVIQVVLFAANLYATGTRAALALPFVLGMGMAAPWPLAGAGIAALPKPGAWMVRVKQAFGVFILLTAAYYAYIALEIFRDRSVDPAEVSASVGAKLREGWHASLAEGLDVARRENKPVLVDIWATWCKNCLTMDKTTLVDPGVKAALDGYVKVKFQAEVPDEPPARDVMQRFGAVGLPTYVVLTPKK
jgi:thiol:disulfide interchange protein DsbD